jgi:hypothetical protein
MGLTKHPNALSVLEKRALRYRGRGGVQSSITTDVNSIDETGMVEIGELTDSDSDGGSQSGIVSINNDELTIAQRELEEIKGVVDELLKVHGVLALGAKAEE